MKNTYEIPEVSIDILAGNDIILVSQPNIGDLENIKFPDWSSIV